jgi:multicomponent Na+:H+ antiporter subunit D
MIPAMSLAGMPPLSGFFAKLGIISAGLAERPYLLVAAAIVAGLLTLFSMTKIWGEAFWKPMPSGVEGPDAADLVAAGRMMWPIAVLAAITVTLGFGAGWLYDLSMRAASQLIDKSEYIRAVLG